jgi:putative DNA primase/helicase
MSRPKALAVQARPRVEPDQTRRFLAHILDPSVGCFEIRCFSAIFDRTSGRIVPASNLSSTLAGWYDSIDDALVDLGKLDGVSAYVTLNPVTPDLLSRKHNGIARQKAVTRDADVVAVRWLFVDIDPIRPDGISSTDVELRSAYEVQTEILAQHPEIEAASIYGCSGNGAWILVRLPDYDPTTGRDLGHHALAWLNQTYSTPAAKVDVKAVNPSRVMCTPGTIKTKGEHSPARPWRLATIDSPDGRSLAPLDLAGWLDGKVVAPKAVQPGGSGSNGRAQTNGHVPAPYVPLPGRDVILHRARLYLSNFDPAVSGQGGHDQTFDAACTLVWGWALSADEARPILADWNVSHCQPPWTAGELEHKLEDAGKVIGKLPRGHLADDANRANGNGHVVATIPLANRVSGSDFDLNTEPDGPDAPARTDRPCPEGQEENPHRLARLVFDRYRHHEGPRLRYWQEDWWLWESGHYRAVPAREIQAEIHGAMWAEFEAIFNYDLMQFGMKKKAAVGGDGPAPKRPKKLPVSSRLSKDVELALRQLCILSSREVESPPAWVGVDVAGWAATWQPKDLLPAANAIVHLPTLAMVGGEKADLASMTPTPRLFSCYSLVYDFNPAAQEPREWLKFLASIWPNAQDAIDTLQEWFGYLLTADTTLQKILLVIGPPRSGKGTIIRILCELIGLANIASPRLASFAGDFGLAPLVGKSVAVIADARIGGRQDKAAIVETLLSISGEDAQTVNRKYRDVVTLKLPTRFVIVSNEIPKLRDNSGAFAARCVCLALNHSFLGKEDRQLMGRLKPELDGILLWAIEGWKRLQARGAFVQPESGRSLADDLEAETADIRTFVNELCVVQEGGNERPSNVQGACPERPRKGLSVPVSDLYAAWKTWNQEREEEHVGSRKRFLADLRTAFPFIEHGRERSKLDWQVRHNVMLGIRLMTSEELFFRDQDGNQHPRTPY